MHTDRPNLDESCHCPQSRPAALIRVLDIEPSLEATHGFHATSLACQDSPCTVSGCLFFRLTPELPRQPHHGTECGRTSTSPHVQRVTAAVVNQCRLFICVECDLASTPASVAAVRRSRARDACARAIVLMSIEAASPNTHQISRCANPTFIHPQT